MRAFTYVLLAALSTSKLAYAGIFAASEDAPKTQPKDEIDSPASEEAPRLPRDANPSRASSGKSSGLFDSWFGGSENRAARPQQDSRSTFATGMDGKDAGDTSISAVVMPAAESISGELALTYYLNPYVFYNFSGYYQQRQSEERRWVSYGPTADFGVRFANVTNLVPFAAVGVGYQKWHLYDNLETFDDDESATYSSVIGIRAGLTRNFGLQVTNRWITYLGETPMRFEPNQERYSRTQGHADVGFYVTM